MAIKKSELYSSLWAGADSLRGGMDASEYKNYVLNLLFLKYISDKAKNNNFSEIEVPQGCFYEDILALEGDKEIGDKLNKIIAKIAERNDLKGVIDSVDFNDNTKLGEGKAMVDTLSNLVKIFADLSLGAHGALDDDLLGDAYEYLMRHFASESGKSKGQFYTPSEVSLLLSLLLGIDENTRQDKSIYDPTCGSGSLLLKASSLAGKKGLTIYGQEKDISTTALCKMNMILHHSADADIAKGGSSTLSNPLFIKNNMLQTFDYCLANPPFSLKNWTDGLSIDPKSKQVINDRFNRFEDGTPPEKNGDFAFLLHIIKSLKNTGKGAVILPHGVLFRGNAEGVIRKNLLLKGYIKGVIGLAPNLFYGTSIPACVIVLDKENAHARKGVFMIDASKDFKKDGNKNRLRDQDVQKMIDTFNALKEIPYYSKMVSLEEISANDYNLNIPRYIASKQESEKDLFALINSHKASYLPKNEIKAYAPYFRMFKELKNTLFKKSDKEGYYALKTECENIKELIIQSLEYQTFHASVLSAFDRLELSTTFNDFIEPGFNPKTLIESVCSKVLKEFEKVGILDKYGVYQLFKDYYNEVLQDDWFLISFNGFESAKELRKLTPLKDKNKKANYLEEPDFVIQKTYYKSDLIPKNLIKQRFFEKEAKELEELENALNEKEALLDELIEEHSNEEGLFDGLKINESVLKKELKNATDPEDKEILKTALEWLEAKNKALKMKNKAHEELELKAFHQYKNLELSEIKDLIIKDKWLKSLKNALENKIQKRINAFISALNEIISSYSNSLLELDKEVKESESKVLEHLKDLGLMG